MLDHDKVKLVNSIEYNLTVQRISKPPKPLEMAHYLGNCLGLIRSGFLSNPTDDNLQTLLEALNILNSMTTLNVEFDESKRKFTADNGFIY